MWFIIGIILVIIVIGMFTTSQDSEDHYLRTHNEVRNKADTNYGKNIYGRKGEGKDFHPPK